MDKKTAKQIVAKMEEILGKELGEYGQQISARFSQNDIKLTIVLSEIVNGISMDEKTTDLVKIAERRGWDLSKKAQYATLGRVSLVGYSRRSTKYPWIIRVEDGENADKQYKVDNWTLRNVFGYEV